MPRFYFDLVNGVTRPDDEGTVLPDVEAARDEACETLLAIARDNITADGARQMSIIVRDEVGKKLVTMTLNYSEEPGDVAS